MGTSVFIVGADEPSLLDFAVAQCESCKSVSEKPRAQKSKISAQVHIGHYWAVRGTFSLLRIALNNRLPNSSKRLTFQKLDELKTFETRMRVPVPVPSCIR